MMRSVLGSNASIGGVLGRGRAAAAGGNGLLTGLVAYWGLDEASGNALDKHGGGLTLTQVNSPGADTGIVYGTARTFNGSNQCFSRNSEAAITFGNVDYAVAMWIYLADLNSRYMLGKGNAVDGTDWDYAASYIASNGLRWTIGNGTGLTSLYASTFGIPSIDTWHLLIARHVSATKTIYISVNNGTEDSLTYTGTHDTTTKPLAIGRLSDYGSFLWSGRIGPIAFWKNRTLSADDRTALWNGSAGLAYSAFTS